MKNKLKLKLKEAQEAQNRLFEHQKSLQTKKIQKHINERFKTPPGGIGAQPIPSNRVEAIEKYMKENPNATADELALGLGKLALIILFKSIRSDRRSPGRN